MYTCTQVTVKDNGGAEIATFVENAEGNLVLTDGLHGTYTGELGDLVISGSGIATLGDKTGTYVKADGADYTLDVYVDGSYYQVTLADGAYTAVKPMATITFDLGGVVPEQQVPQSVEVNVNVAYALPADLTNDTKIFAGLVLRRRIHASRRGAVCSHSKRDASRIVDKQDTYRSRRRFGRRLPPTSTWAKATPSATCFPPTPWTATGTSRAGILKTLYETVVAAEAVITASDDGKTLYALWTEIPAYVGEYHGSEMWGKSSGNSSHKSISIDEQGNITSSISSNSLNGAVVTRYEPDEQKVYYKQPDGTTEYCFYFDAETGIIAGIYSRNEIGNDFYLLSKAATEDNFKASVNYGIDAPKTPGGTVTGYYLRIVTLNTLLGERTNSDVRQPYLQRRHVEGYPRQRLGRP